MRKKIQKLLETIPQQLTFKMTPLRENVLFLLCASQHPLTAYDLLRELRKTNPTAEPPTVYRVLEFFQEQGIIHRIESNNSYIPCFAPTTIHHNQLLICKSCSHTIELNDKKLYESLKKCAKEKKFELSNDLTEIRGYCEKCVPSRHVACEGSKEKSHLS